MSIADRKKNRAQRKASLRKKAEQKQSKTNYNDPRVWRCERDKTGKGEAVIRFLEPTDAMIEWYMEKYGVDSDSVPSVLGFHKHNFKGPTGKWYIEKCPTSQPGDERECPVCEANGELVDEAGGWNEMDDNHPNKKLVRQRKRKETYLANILVISDPKNPENEGEVKIFEFGKAINDMIQAQLVPEFDDEEECDVSDFWEGRNFKLRIVQKDGFANYDKSTWEDSSPVFDDDDEIDALLEKCHPIHELLDADKYKSYDDLTKQFERATSTATNRRRVSDDEGDDGGSAPESEKDRDDKPSRSERRSRRGKDPEPTNEDTGNTSDASGSDDDNDDYFASLLDD